MKIQALQRGEPIGGFRVPRYRTNVHRGLDALMIDRSLGSGHIGIDTDRDMMTIRTYRAIGHF